MMKMLTCPIPHEGPHDDELTWPLRGSLLLNQIRDHELISVTVSFDDDHSGETTGRVTDDNIYSHAIYKIDIQKTKR